MTTGHRLKGHSRSFEENTKKHLARGDTVSQGRISRPCSVPDLVCLIPISMADTWKGPFARFIGLVC